MKELDWARLVGLMRSPHLLDGRHALDRARLTALGYRYLTLAGNEEAESRPARTAVSAARPRTMRQH